VSGGPLLGHLRASSPLLQMLPQVLRRLEPEVAMRTLVEARHQVAALAFCPFTPWMRER
jgi:hypothetical protein